MPNDDYNELYELLFRVVDGYNRTHDSAVDHLEYQVWLSDLNRDHRGTVVYPRRENLLRGHYRGLSEADDDWYDVEGQDDCLKDVSRIELGLRREAQRLHREGRLRFAPSYLRAYMKR